MVHSILICMTRPNNLVSSTNFVMAVSQMTYEYIGRKNNRILWTFPLVWKLPIYSYLFPFFWTIIYLWEGLFSYFMIAYFPLEPMVSAFLGAMKISINKTFFFSYAFHSFKNPTVCKSGLPLQRVCWFFFLFPPVCAAVHLFLDNASTPFPSRFIILKFHRCQILKSFWYLATFQ